MRTLSVVLLAVSALIVDGCGAKHSAPPTGDVAGPSLDSLRPAIQTLTDDPVCSDVSQCRSVAFGSKPCGGPWSYLVFSTVATDSNMLARLVTEYNAIEAQQNERLGRSSDCQMVTAPQLNCVQNKCMAVPQS